MRVTDAYRAQAELKFLTDEPPGTFGGLGAVYGNVDSHGDLIVPGAFSRTLAEHKAAGTMPRMYVEHSAWTGGDPLPIGIWTEIIDEPEGLRVKGRLIGTCDPRVKRCEDLINHGVLGGLSIAYLTPPGGAVFGKKSTDPRRTLHEVKLLSIDVVADPSNSKAQIDGMKSVMMQADHETACASIASALQVYRDSLSGGNSPNVEQRSMLLQHLQEAHMALTGSPLPKSMKSLPTLREAEAAIGMMFGLSHSQVRAITEHGLKTWLSRDETRELVELPDKAALADLKASLAGFSLPSFIKE